MRAVIWNAVIIVCLILALCAGCTHHFLQRNTARHASTISDILYQQVMDNIALFCNCPGALPHFAVLSDGTTQATDQTTPTGGLKWNAHRIFEEALGTSVNRQLMENWKIAPVTSAGRLNRMRCALQFVVAPPVFVVEEKELEGLDGLWFYIADSPCTKCIAELTKMQLLPKPSSDLIVKGQVIVRDDRYYFRNASLAHAHVLAMMDGIACNFPSGWFCCSTKKPPSDACFVGRCGKTYVWSTGNGIDELSRFTITLLTLATLDPPSPYVTVTRALKGPIGEDLTVEGQVPGDVINFRLPKLIASPALQEAAKQLSAALSKENTDNNLPGPDVKLWQKDGRDNRLPALLRAVADSPTVDPNTATELITILESIQDDVNKEGVADPTLLNSAPVTLSDSVLSLLKSAPIEMPNEPSILNQPGYMPFSHPSPGAEFVPQVQ